MEMVVGLSITKDVLKGLSIIGARQSDTRTNWRTIVASCRCSHLDMTHHYGLMGQRGECLALNCECVQYEESEG